MGGGDNEQRGGEVGYHRGKKLPQSLEKQEIFVKSSVGLIIWVSEQNLSYCSLGVEKEESFWKSLCK